MTQRNARTTTLSLAVGAACLAGAGGAQAFKFDLENGITGSFDSTISYGIQVRLQKPDGSIIGRDNGGNVDTTGNLGTLVNGPGGGATANPDFNYVNTDDGTLNYKRGQVVSSVLKGTHELFLKEQGNWAALGRFTWSSDFAATHTQRTPLDDEAKKAVTQNVSLLDLWVSKDLRLGEQNAKLKLGNQVISWGEDIFIIGGVNSINALDIRKAHIPGTQLKEIFIPAPIVSFNSSLGSGFSTEAYYQFRWNKFIFDPAGTYWSSADFIGKGGKRGAFIPASYGGIGDFDPTRGRSLSAIDTALGRIPVEITSPGNSGQYGLNLRFKPSEGDTEYAAYFIRYHDKLPFIGFKFNPTTPNLFGATAVEQYGENRRLFGLSANTKIGDWAFGAEISYRPKDSVAIDPTVPAVAGSRANPAYSLAAATAGFTQPGMVNGYVDEKKWQTHLTAFRFLPPDIYRALGAAEGYVMGEMAFTRYPNLDLSGAVPYLLNNYTLPTRNSWGYVAEFGLTYANIFQSGWTLSPIIDFYHDVRGVSPNTIPFIEGRKAIAVGMNFDLHNKYKVNLGYTTFFGGGNLNMMRDRDVLSASFSLTF